MHRIQFLSTPSARRATCRSSVSGPSSRFLSTPSARRATQALARDQRRFDISIHALREEGDQSTPRRGAGSQNFYPRPPRGGRRFSKPAAAAKKGISIHALREEGDPSLSMYNVSGRVFLSTPSARRATRLCRCITSPAGYFYPRPPRGGRPVTLTGIPGVVKFLSTPSARRATSEIYGEERAYQFLSTPSARRATADVPWCIPSTSHFYPRPPRGGRRADSGSGKIGKRISIHALREEGDRPYRHHLQQCCKISIHALREEGDMLFLL